MTKHKHKKKHINKTELKKKTLKKYPVNSIHPTPHPVAAPAEHPVATLSARCSPSRTPPSRCSECPLAPSRSALAASPPPPPTSPRAPTASVPEPTAVPPQAHPWRAQGPAGVRCLLRTLAQAGPPCSVPRLAGFPRGR